MSTTFDVYPGNRNIPTFRNVLEEASGTINEHLSNLGVRKTIQLNVKIKEFKSDEDVRFSLDDRFIWNEDRYAWFYFDHIAGGTDVYYNQIIPINKKAWEGEIETNSNAQKLKDVINTSIELGYYWYFRRSAGQPAIINLAYGLIAASLAKITDGFIYSDDGAWDYNIMPALPDDFINLYFKPELASDRLDKEWFRKCIKQICKDFK